MYVFRWWDTRYIYTRMYIHVCVSYTPVWVCMCLDGGTQDIHTSTHIHVCISYTPVYTRMYIVYARIGVYVFRWCDTRYTYVYTYTHIHVCISICPYIHVCISYAPASRVAFASFCHAHTTTAPKPLPHPNHYYS